MSHELLGAKKLTKTKSVKPLDHVTIYIIDHDKQRYETAGDWILLDDNVGQSLAIFTSKLKNDPNNLMALAVAYHELGEALGCLANGITQKQVDDFDMNYRGKGERGDDPNCPYQAYHGFATACERILIHAMGLSWGVYEKAIDSLPKRKKK